MTNPITSPSDGREINWHYFGKRLHAIRGDIGSFNQPTSICGITPCGWSCDPFNDDKHIIVRCRKCSRLLGTEVIVR